MLHSRAPGSVISGQLQKKVGVFIR
jgi:hypothetical protein